MINRVVLVKVLGNTKYEFVHQKYAEHLVTDFIFTNIATKTPLSSSDDLHELFLATMKNENLEDSRKFIDTRLKTYDRELKIDILSKKLEKSLKKESNRNNRSKISSSLF